MALDYIIKRVSQKTGLDITEHRAVIVDTINEAALELWESTDLPHSLKEQVFPVYAYQQIAFPSYVSELRGMREYSYIGDWKLVDVRPRYNKSPWKDAWNEWREKGLEPTQKSIDNAGPLTLQSLTQTAGVSVTISGRTAEAANLSVTSTISDWVLTAGFYVGTINTAFLEIHEISKSGRTTSDIHIYDPAGEELAVISNDKETTKYLLVDVSGFPYSSVNATPFYMEVLYKQQLPRLTDDSDRFPVHGYDSIIVTKSLALYYSEDKGSEQKSLLFDAKAERESKRKQTDKDRGKIQKIDFVPHPHDTLVGRGRRTWLRDY